MFSFILFIIITIKLIKLTDIGINTIHIASLKYKEKRRLEDGLVVLNHLHYLTPGEFEVWCGEFLSKNGFENIQITKLRADGGKDIICKKNGKKVYVECKRYSSSNLAMYGVNKEVVKNLAGAMIHDGIEHGIIITTGLADKSAYQYIKDLSHLCKIEIINGRMLENNSYNLEASMSLV